MSDVDTAKALRIAAEFMDGSGFNRAASGPVLIQWLTNQAERLERKQAEDAQIQADVDAAWQAVTGSAKQHILSADELAFFKALRDRYRKLPDAEQVGRDIFRWIVGTDTNKSWLDNEGFCRDFGKHVLSVIGGTK